MNSRQLDGNYDSKRPDHCFTLSLAKQESSIEVRFEDNPNLILEIEEFRDVVGLSSTAQVGFLINQDHSCWLTNLGRSDTTEVYRPANKIHRKLAHHQVAYLRHGDYLGLYGAFYRIEIKRRRLCLVPIQFPEQ